MHSALYGSRELRAGEAVVTTVYRSPWLSLGGLALLGGLVLGDFFFLAWFFARGRSGALGFFVVLALGILAGTRAVTEWRNSRTIVTNQRILVVRQQGLFTRSVAEVPLEKIQDVRFESRGLRATLFRLGDVTVEVTGSTTPVLLPGVPHPEAVQELLGRLQEEHRKLLPVIPRTPTVRVDGVRPV